MACILLTATLITPSTLAQEPDATPPQTETPFVTFNFTGPLRVQDLVDYVARSTDTQFMYDEQLTGKVILRGPTRMPTRAVPDLLRSVLRFKGYTLVERNGWYGIIKLGNQVGDAPLGSPETLPEGEVPITLILQLKNADAARILTTLKPMLSQPGGNGILVVETNMLILTDFSDRLQRISELITLLDVERPAVRIEIFPLQRSTPSKVAPLLEEILSAIEKAHDNAGGAPLLVAPQIVSSDRTGELMVVADTEMIERIRIIIQRLDTTTSKVARPYELKQADADSVVNTLQKIFSGLDDNLQATFVKPSQVNAIMVIASPEAQLLAERMIRMLDVVKEVRGELSFYEIENLPAEELLDTLKKIYTTESAGAKPTFIIDPGLNALICRATLEEHQHLRNLIARLDTPRELARSGIRFYPLQNSNAEDVAATLEKLFADGGMPMVLSGDDASDTAEGLSSSGAGRPPANASGTNANSAPLIAISTDLNTNSVIVNAPHKMHQAVGEIIGRLDERRPQVLIEVRIVDISYTDTFNLGVELESSRLGGKSPVLVFSNFGLATALDAETGERLINTTGQGLGVSVVTGNDMDIIIRALQTELNAKVVSSPRLLVNDNKDAIIKSVTEEPYTSINAGDTVATTSFAGYAEAGTELSMKPHISRADYVRLKYKINRSGFRGSGTETSPPPRDSDEIESEVTVPDGHVVIVGGLSDNRHSTTTSSIPYLGSIPLIGAAFRSTDKSESRSALFIFIKTTILHNDNFDDLKWLSHEYLTQSGHSQADGVGAIYPPTAPERMVPPQDIP